MVNFDYILEKEEFELEVPLHRMGKFEKLMDKVGFKVNALKIAPPKFKIMEEYRRIVKLEIKRDGEIKNIEQEYLFFKIVVTGIMPKIADHSLAVILERLPESKGVVPVYNSIPIKDEWLNHDEFNCDKCNTKRKRNKMYGFIHEKTEKIVFIGGECAKDFSKQSTLQYLSELSAFLNTFINIKDEDLYMDDEYEGNNNDFSVRDILAVAIARIKAEGYRKADENESTKEIVEKDLVEMYGGKRRIDIDFSQADEFLSLPDKNTFIAQLKTHEDIKHKFKALVKENYVRSNYIGVICYLAFMLLQDSLNDSKRDNEVKSQNVGAVGEKINITAKVIYKKHEDSAYNRSGLFYIKFLTDDSNVLETRSSGSFVPELGSILEFSAKVKRHRVTQKGECITVITHCKTTNSKSLIDYLAECSQKINGSKFSVLNKDSDRYYSEVYELLDRNGIWRSLATVTEFHCDLVKIFKDQNETEHTRISEVTCNDTSFRTKIKLKYIFDPETDLFSINLITG